MALCPRHLVEMVAHLLPLQTIVELEGLCQTTRQHYLSSSFWAGMAPLVSPRFRLPACLQAADRARTVKEFLFLLMAVAAPAPTIQLRSAAEAKGLMDSVRRAKQRVSESQVSNARKLTMDYCRAAQLRGAQLYACRLYFQEVSAEDQKCLGTRWEVALRQQRQLRLELLWTGSELRVRGCSGAPQLSFELFSASEISVQLRGQATSAPGRANSAVVMAAGDVASALRAGVLFVLSVQARPRLVEEPKSTIPFLQLSSQPKAGAAAHS